MQKHKIAKKERVTLILQALDKLYPTLKQHLTAVSPWELLVATVLSAQCTDARVNQVTPALFKALPTIQAFALIEPEKLEELIYSTGFYRNKSKNLISTAKKIIELYEGEVPKSMEELITLDGVARKTANVVLWNAFGLNEGLAVDTHVARISVRLGLCKSSSAEAIELALCQVFPKSEWGVVNHRMVSFGRDFCKARSPLCLDCPMQAFCPFFIKNNPQT